MQYQVLVENVADEMGDVFNIEVPGLPSPVSANPWPEVHGSLRDDPTFDDFMTEISSHRRGNDTGESEQ